MSCCRREIGQYIASGVLQENVFRAEKVESKGIGYGPSLRLKEVGLCWTMQFVEELGVKLRGGEETVEEGYHRQNI